MNDVKRKKKSYIGLGIFLLVILGFLLLSWKTGPIENFFDTEEVYELDTVWYGDGEAEGVSSLPAVFACDETGTASIHTTIPEDWAEYGNTFCFRASQEAVRVWIDGTLMLEQGQSDSGMVLFGETPSSSWVLMRLPADSAGKELRIELSSPYEEYQGLLNEVYIGTKAAILFFLFHMYGLGFSVAILLLVMSGIMLLFYVLYFARRVSGNQFFFLGIFGMLAGIWMLGESHMLQFFTGRLLAWYNLTLVALHLLPLPLLRIVEKLPDFSYRFICRFSRYFLMAYLGVLIVLQVTGIRDFMQMLNVSLVILLLMCIGIPLFIYWDYLHNKNKKIHSMVVALTVFCAFAGLELGYDLINIRRELGGFLQTGVLAFYVIICFASIRHTLELYVKGLESAYYKELSYKDQLTGCMNRRAFTERENAWVPGQEDVLLMADLNCLKQVNDLLGHHVGDEYIQNCSAAMREIFEEKGTCYRIGGDEFLFWGNSIPEEEMRELEERFRSRVAEKCRAISPLCSVSVGSAFARPEDRSIEEIMRWADKKIYENKRRMKSQPPLRKEPVSEES